MKLLLAIALLALAAVVATSCWKVLRRSAERSDLADVDPLTAAITFVGFVVFVLGWALEVLLTWLLGSGDPVEAVMKNAAYVGGLSWTTHALMLLGGTCTLLGVTRILWRKR